MEETVKKLIRNAETSKSENDANHAMKQIRNIDPTYHFCPDWDGMVICQTNKEWEECTCIKR